MQFLDHLEFVPNSANSKNQKEKEKKKYLGAIFVRHLLTKSLYKHDTDLSSINRFEEKTIHNVTNCTATQKIKCKLYNYQRFYAQMIFQSPGMWHYF